MSISVEANVTAVWSGAKSNGKQEKQGVVQVTVELSFLYSACPLHDSMIGANQFGLFGDIGQYDMALPIEKPFVDLNTIDSISSKFEQRVNTNRASLRNEVGNFKFNNNQLNGKGSHLVQKSCSRTLDALLCMAVAEGDYETAVNLIVDGANPQREVEGGGTALGDTLKLLEGDTQEKFLDLFMGDKPASVSVPPAKREPEKLAVTANSLAPIEAFDLVKDVWHQVDHLYPTPDTLNTAIELTTDLMASSNAVEEGAAARVRTWLGQLVISLIEKGASCSLIEALLAAGADPNVKQIEKNDGRLGDGRASLYQAIMSGQPETAELLLKHGASLSDVTMNNKTPFHALVEAAESMQVAGPVLKDLSVILMGAALDSGNDQSLGNLRETLGVCNDVGRTALQQAQSGLSDLHRVRVSQLREGIAPPPGQGHHSENLSYLADWLSAFAVEDQQNDNAASIMSSDTAEISVLSEPLEGEEFTANHISKREPLSGNDLKFDLSINSDNEDTKSTNTTNVGAKSESSVGENTDKPLSRHEVSSSNHRVQEWLSSSPTDVPAEHLDLQVVQGPIVEGDASDDAASTSSTIIDDTDAVSERGRGQQASIPIPPPVRLGPDGKLQANNQVPIPDYLREGEDAPKYTYKAKPDIEGNTFMGTSPTEFAQALQASVTGSEAKVFNSLASLVTQSSLDVERVVDSLSEDSIPWDCINNPKFLDVVVKKLENSPAPVDQACAKQLSLEKIPEKESFLPKERFLAGVKEHPKSALTVLLKGSNYADENFKKELNKLEGKFKGDYQKTQEQRITDTLQRVFPKEFVEKTLVKKPVIGNASSLSDAVVIPFGEGSKSAIVVAGDEVFVTHWTALSKHPILLPVDAQSKSLVSDGKVFVDTLLNANKAGTQLYMLSEGRVVKLMTPINKRDILYTKRSVEQQLPMDKGGPKPPSDFMAELGDKAANGFLASFGSNEDFSAALMDTFFPVSEMKAEKATAHTASTVSKRSVEIPSYLRADGAKTKEFTSSLSDAVGAKNLLPKLPRSLNDALMQSLGGLQALGSDYTTNESFGGFVDHWSKKPETILSVAASTEQDSSILSENELKGTALEILCCKLSQSKDPVHGSLLRRLQDDNSSEREAFLSGLKNNAEIELMVASNLDALKIPAEKTRDVRMIPVQRLERLMGMIDFKSDAKANSADILETLLNHLRKSAEPKDKSLLKQLEQPGNTMRDAFLSKSGSVADDIVKQWLDVLKSEKEMIQREYERDVIQIQQKFNTQQLTEHLSAVGKICKDKFEAQTKSEMDSALSKYFPREKVDHLLNGPTLGAVDHANGLVVFPDLDNNSYLALQGDKVFVVLWTKSSQTFMVELNDDNKDILTRKLTNQDEFNAIFAKDADRKRFPLYTMEQGRVKEARAPDKVSDLMFQASTQKQTTVGQPSSEGAQAQQASFVASPEQALGQKLADQVFRGKEDSAIAELLLHRASR